MLLKEEREEVVEYGKRMVSSGLTTGTGGNISVADEEKEFIAIKPSGIRYFDISPADVVIIDMNGEVVEGKLKPSSELDFHVGLQNHRGDIKAVVHTHSPFATTIACLGWEIPAVHYLVGFAGGSKIPCAPYATYGSEELSKNICETIGKRKAVLLANHGVAAVGGSIKEAFDVAEQVEFLARLYFQSKCVGTPNILEQNQMEVVLDKFKQYGQA